MKIAYINDFAVIEKSKKVTKKQLLHEEALAAAANMFIRGQKRAERLFAAEFKELEDLKKEANIQDAGTTE